MSDPTFDEQVESFHQQIVELIKRYQFRDRDRILCHGISVSQCYALETLHSYSELTVNELANKMHLSISTITRVVDQLVKAVRHVSGRFGRPPR
jgi:MarR family 2-MHQ and catechol resistance regulon transcriptional repressor